MDDPKFDDLEWAQPPLTTEEDERIELIDSHINAFVFHARELISLVDDLDELKVGGSLAELRAALSAATEKFDPDMDDGRYPSEG